MSLTFLLAFLWFVDCGKISLSDFEQLTLAPLDQDTAPTDQELIDTNGDNLLPFGTSYPLDEGRPISGGIVPLKERRCGRRKVWNQFCRCCVRRF